MNTFQTKSGEVSYVQYYKTQYGIDIKDLKQPLLISREDKRVAGQQEKVTFTFSIIPEISYLTGLTDEQRADFKVSDFEPYLYICHLSLKTLLETSSIPWKVP